MREINIINKVIMNKKGLLVNGSKQLIHLRQGELDGACAVYSMMMCLIIEGIIKRSMVTNVPSRLKRNTADGRLVSYFLEKQGMVIDGYSLEDLSYDLQSAFRKKVIPHYFSLDDVDEDFDLMKEIIIKLEENHPVEIGFDRKGGKSGHAVVLIGYKQNAGSVTFYCLDPGYPIEPGQFWNNVLKVTPTARAKYNCFNVKENTTTFIDEFLVFEKRQ